MRVTVFAGGYGGAKFTRGLREYSAAGSSSHEISVVVNTADDMRLHGLRISPDLDTVMYTLGGGLDEDRGWGREDEGFRASEELRAYGMPNPWFGLGDRDIATHLVRTQMLEAGYSLTRVTEALCRRWQPGVQLLPMTDDRVETHVVVGDPEPRAIHFQEWWLRYAADLPAHRFVQVGAEEARPGPGVSDAILNADAVVFAPSNPVVSIGAILSVPGIARAVRETPAPVVGVSPIVGGAPVRGMADRCLRAVGVETTAGAVASHFGRRVEGGLLDAWLVDDVDADAAEELRSSGWVAEAVPLMMTDVTAAAAIADAALRLAESLRPSRRES